MASPPGDSFEKRVSFATNVAAALTQSEYGEEDEPLSPKPSVSNDTTEDGTASLADPESIPSSMLQVRKELGDRAMTKQEDAGRKRWSSMTCFNIDTLCIDSSCRGSEVAIVPSPLTTTTTGNKENQRDAPGLKFRSNLSPCSNDSLETGDSILETGDDDDVVDEDAFLPDADEAFLPPDEEEAFLPPDAEVAFLPDITDEDFMPQDESAFLPTLEVEVDPMCDPQHNCEDKQPDVLGASRSEEASLDDDQDIEECTSQDRCSIASEASVATETSLEESMEPLAMQDTVEKLEGTMDEMVDGRTEVPLEEHTRKVEEIFSVEQETEALTAPSSNEEIIEESPLQEEIECHLHESESIDETENHVVALESNDTDIEATDDSSHVDTMKEATENEAPDEPNDVDADDNSHVVAIEEATEREGSDEPNDVDAEVTDDKSHIVAVEETTEKKGSNEELLVEASSDLDGTAPSYDLEETETMQMVHEIEQMKPSTESCSHEEADETIFPDNDLEQTETTEMPHEDEQVEVESCGQETDEQTPIVSPNTSDDTAARDEINNLRLQLKLSEDEKHKAVSDAVRQIESRLRHDNMKEVVKVAQSAKIAHSVRLSSAEKDHIEREKKLRQENKQQMIKIAGAMKVASAIRNEFAADDEFCDLRTLKSSLENLLTNQKATIESLQSSVAEKEHQIDELKAELSQSRQQEQQASSSLRVAEKTLISVKAELSTTRASKRDTEKSLDEANQNIESLRSDLDTAEHSLKEASTQLQIGEKRKDTIEELEAERYKLKASVENLQQENTEMRTLTNRQAIVIVENESSLIKLKEEVERLQTAAKKNSEMKQLCEQQKDIIQVKDRSLEEMKSEIRELLESVNRADSEKQNLEVQHEQHLQVLNEKVRSLSEDSLKLKTILSSRSKGSVYCSNSEDSDDSEAHYQSSVSASISGDGTQRSESSCLLDTQAVGVRTCVATSKTDPRLLGRASDGKVDPERNVGKASREAFCDDVDPIFSCSAVSENDLQAENEQNQTPNVSIATKKCKEELNKMDKTASYDKFISCGCYTPSVDFKNKAVDISMSNSIADDDTTAPLDAKERDKNNQGVKTADNDTVAGPDTKEQKCFVEPEIRKDESNQGVEMSASAFVVLTEAEKPVERTIADAVVAASSSGRGEADKTIADVLIEGEDDADMNQIEAVLNSSILSVVSCGCGNPVASSNQKSESNSATEAQTCAGANTENTEKITKEEVSEGRAASYETNKTAILDAISDLKLNDYIDGSEVIPMTKKLETLSEQLMKIMSQPERGSPKNVLEEKVGFFKVAVRTLQREKEKALKEKERQIEEKDRTIAEMREKLAKHEKQMEDEPKNETCSQNQISAWDETLKPHSLTIMTAQSEDSTSNQVTKQDLPRSEEKSTALAASTPDSNPQSISAPADVSSTSTIKKDRKATGIPATTPRVPLHLRSTTPGANASKAIRQPKSVVAKSTGVPKGPSKRSSIQPPTPTSLRRSSLQPPTPTSNRSSIRPPTPRSRLVSTQPPTPTSARLGYQAKKGRATATKVTTVIARLEKKSVTPSVSSGVGKKVSRLPKPPTRSSTKASRLTQPQGGKTKAIKQDQSGCAMKAGGIKPFAKGLLQPQAGVPGKPPVQEESQRRPPSIATSDLEDSFASLLKTREEMSTPSPQPAGAVEDDNDEPTEETQETGPDHEPSEPNEQAEVEKNQEVVECNNNQVGDEIQTARDVSPSSVSAESISAIDRDAVMIPEVSSADNEETRETMQEEESETESEIYQKSIRLLESLPSANSLVESPSSIGQQDKNPSKEEPTTVSKDGVAKEPTTIEAIPSDRTQDDEARSDESEGRQHEVEERDDIPWQGELKLISKSKSNPEIEDHSTTKEDDVRGVTNEVPPAYDKGESASALNGPEITGVETSEPLNVKGAATTNCLDLLNAEIAGTSDDLDFAAESDDDSFSQKKPSKAIQLE